MFKFLLFLAVSLAVFVSFPVSANSRCDLYVDVSISEYTEFDFYSLLKDKNYEVYPEVWISFANHDPAKSICGLFTALNTFISPEELIGQKVLRYSLSGHEVILTEVGSAPDSDNPGCYQNNEVWSLKGVDSSTALLRALVALPACTK